MFIKLVGMTIIVVQFIYPYGGVNFWLMIIFVEVIELWFM